MSARLFSKSSDVRRWVIFLFTGCTVEFSFFLPLTLYRLAIFKVLEMQERACLVAMLSSNSGQGGLGIYTKVFKPDALSHLDIRHLIRYTLSSLQNLNLQCTSCRALWSFSNMFSISPGPPGFNSTCWNEWVWVTVTWSRHFPCKGIQSSFESYKTMWHPNLYFVHPYLASGSVKQQQYYSLLYLTTVYIIFSQYTHIKPGG